MTEQDVLISYLPAVWIKHFPNIPILGGKYELISLDERFFEFLESDGLILDHDTTLESSFSSSEEDSIEDSDDTELLFTPSAIFPDIDSKIKHVVSNFSNGVVPKINWTVPKVNNFLFVTRVIIECRIRYGFQLTLLNARPQTRFISF